MKTYLVFLTDLALAPLMGQASRGAKLETFDNLLEAQDFAESTKSDWDRIFVLSRLENGEVERLEHYHKGRKYPADIAVSED